VYWSSHSNSLTHDLTPTTPNVSSRFGRALGVHRPRVSRAPAQTGQRRLHCINEEHTRRRQAVTLCTAGPEGQPQAPVPATYSHHPEHGAPVCNWSSQLIFDCSTCPRTAVMT